MKFYLLSEIYFYVKDYQTKKLFCIQLITGISLLTRCSFHSKYKRRTSFFYNASRLCEFRQQYQSVNLMGDIDYWWCQIYILRDIQLSKNQLSWIQVSKKITQCPVVKFYKAAAAVLSNLKKIEVNMPTHLGCRGSWWLYHIYLCQLLPKRSSDKILFQPLPYLLSIFTVIKSRLMNFKEL